MEALAYVHSQGVAHRDIKLENVMVDINLKTFLIDFDLSKISMSEYSYTPITEGTVFYLSPESVITDEIEVNRQRVNKITNKVDVWALGILSYQLLYGIYLFRPKVKVLS